MLQRLLDETRVDAGRDSRRRRRVLQALAEETATLHGALVDLAERQSNLVVRTVAGHTHRGQLRVVGDDFIVLTTGGTETWLPVDALELLRPALTERNAPATGDRSSVDLRLAEALGRVAPDRPDVSVQTASGESMLGTMRAVGADVLSLELDGPERQVCYVRLASVLSLVFRSG